MQYIADDIPSTLASTLHNACIIKGNSPLSKRVADWGEDGLAFNYGIVWGRIRTRNTFSLTQLKFQFNNEQKFKYCMTLKRMKMLKQKG